MVPSSLPTYATPWTSPSGVEWCVTPDKYGAQGNVLLYKKVDGRWSAWQSVHKDVPRSKLLAGMGQQCPPTEKPVFRGINASGRTTEYQKQRDGKVFWRYEAPNAWRSLHYTPIECFTTSELEAIIQARNS